MTMTLYEGADPTLEAATALGLVGYRDRPHRCCLHLSVLPDLSVSSASVTALLPTSATTITTIPSTTTTTPITTVSTFTTTTT